MIFHKGGQIILIFGQTIQGNKYRKQHFNKKYTSEAVESGNKLFYLGTKGNEFD